MRRRHTLITFAARASATVLTAAGLMVPALAVAGGSSPAVASTTAMTTTTAAATTTGAATTTATATTTAAVQTAAAIARSAGHARPAGTGSLLLINGDRLTMTTASGRSLIAVRRASGADAVLSLRLGGQQAEIPAVALPYLNRGLSPGLFNVSALRRDESARRLPVTLAFGGRRPAVPGVTITRSSAGRAAGFLTASSARAFGTALRRQYLSDQASGRFGGHGLFSRGLTISLPGAEDPAPTRPTPAFRMHTLTVHGTNLQGKPASSGGVFILNVDNALRFAGLAEIENDFVRGTARFSVPAGHYWAFGYFEHQASTGGSVRMVVLPQFTVGAGHTTAHIAETAASSRVTISVSRPTGTLQGDFTVNRPDRHGHLFANLGCSWSGKMTAFVSPTSRKPSVGTLHAYTSATLVSPRTAARPYAYNLDFPAPAGIVPAQHFAVSPASLAAVTERYYRDQPVTGRGADWTAFGGTAAQLRDGEVQTIARTAMPQVQTQFFSAAPRLLWQNIVWPEMLQFPGGIDGNFTAYAAGENRTENWNNYPLHPAPDVAPAGAAGRAQPAFASAFRSGNTLHFTETPYTDNQAGHLNDGLDAFGPARAAASFAVDQNGRQIAHGSALGGIPGIRLSPHPARIRLTLDASRSGRGMRLSPSSQTTWTWRSVRDTAAHVPGSYFCGPLFRDRRCAAQPALSLDYDVRGMTLRGLTSPGQQLIDVTAGHVEPAAATPVQSLVALFSVNDGRTWTPATVTPAGRGHFRVSFSAPAGADVSLRVMAADQAGGTIAETITRAYGVSQSASVAPAGGRVTHARAGSARGPAGRINGARVRATQAPAGQVLAAQTSTTTTARARAGWGRTGGEPARLKALADSYGTTLRPACPAAPAGQMRCFALYRPQAGVDRALAAGNVTHPSGWSPQALERAYRLPVGRHSNQTVAVSIAFHTPKLADYLATYRRHFGLPPCTESSGCLRIVNQQGQAKPLAPSGLGTGWDLEATLDVSMISAACPHCKILVVEGNSANFPDLARTEVTAARLGAQVISNSYGGRETGSAMSFARDYRRAGHTIVASSGDLGFDAANFPANLAVVTAVGGTTLHRARNARGFTERAWNDRADFAAGSSGCSAYVAKPSWQHDAHCGGRTVADVSAVASNVPIFNRFYGGWITVAGTSVAAPLVAGAYGLAGNASHLTPRWLYRHRRDYFDITAGNNALIGSPGQVCGSDYLCQAHKGYDGPTGLGTPDGIAGL